MTEPQSPCGSAWASEPATVPRLRTSGSEICRAASPSSRRRPRRSSERSQVLWRTRAPIRRAPPSSARVSSPSIRLMSTSAPGAANRSFSSGIRLWPPASTFPSSPSRSSVDNASSSVAGAKYWNLGGYIRRPPRTSK